jgi:hypothetical protein
MLDRLAHELADGLPVLEPVIVRRAGAWHQSDVLAALLTLAQAGALIRGQSGKTPTYTSTDTLRVLINQAYGDSSTRRNTRPSSSVGHEAYQTSRFGAGEALDWRSLI